MHELTVDLLSQEEQYAAGLEYIRGQIDTDVVMVVDCDEVWDSDHIERAKHQIAADASGTPAYQTKIHTYLKTPFYRVRPPFGCPVTFFREPRYLTQSARGNTAPSRQLDNVWFHHFTYVRSSYAIVARKLRTSCRADGNEQIVSDWKEQIWDRLPHAQNLHAFERWRAKWRRIETIWLSELPAVVRESALIKQFLPFGELIAGEEFVLRNLAQGKSLCIDLGTFLGRSAVILGLGAQRVASIDLFEQVGDYDGACKLHRELRRPASEIQSYFRQRYSNVEIVQSDTTEAASRFQDGTVELLFEDSDHRYEVARRNAEVYLPKLTTGGILLLHDCNPMHPGVLRLSNELQDDSRVRLLDLGATCGSLRGYAKR